MTDRPVLIAGRFAVDFSRKLPDAGGGLPAFAVDGGMMAVQVQRSSPARARVIAGLAKVEIENLLVPAGHGPAVLPSEETGYFVVTAAPPGAPLSAAMQPWLAHDLIAQVLRPAAAALCELEKAGVTHRAIRLNNLFLGSQTSQVTLGCAWAEAAGYRQPASVQPPYFTVCDPGGQGDGVIADDVYALGVILIWLTLGRDPLAGLDDATIVQRKLDLGSYAALVGAERLPAGIAELVRAMVADDPEHRPAPALLLGEAPSARRPNPRPARRAQRPLELAGESVWTLRSLADLVRRQPAQCLPPLRNGHISQWVRRSAGDISLGARLDEVLGGDAPALPGDRRRSDATTIMQVVAVLDPLAPLVWRDAVFWPAGLGAKLCHTMVASPGSLSRENAVDAIPVEMIEPWRALRSKRIDPAVPSGLSREAQRWLLQKPLDQGAVRLCYALNPLQPCASPLLAPGWVIGLGDVLPAMEAHAAAGRGVSLIDQDIVALIAARNGSVGNPVLGRALADMSDASPLSTLRLLAALQAVAASVPVPSLAGRVAHGIPAIQSRYHSKLRRERLTKQLAATVQAGDLQAMLQTLENKDEDQADASGHVAALARLETIDQLIADLAHRGGAAEAGARRAGHDIALGAGMLAFGVALAVALVS